MFDEIVKKEFRNVNPLKKFPRLLDHPISWQPNAIVRVENFWRVKKNYLFYNDMHHAHFNLDECVKWVILSKDELTVGTKTTYTSFMWFTNMLGAERVNTRTRRLFWGD